MAAGNAVVASQSSAGAQIGALLLLQEKRSVSAASLITWCWHHVYRTLTKKYINSLLSATLINKMESVKIS